MSSRYLFLPFRDVGARTWFSTAWAVSLMRIGLNYLLKAAVISIPEANISSRKLSIAIFKVKMVVT